MLSKNAMLTILGLYSNKYMAPMFILIPLNNTILLNHLRFNIIPIIFEKITN